MTRINKDTGLLFDLSDPQQHLQSVVDRLMTRRGSRELRPGYGASLAGIAPADPNLPEMVRAALASDSAITNITVEREQNTLSILVDYPQGNIRVRP